MFHLTPQDLEMAIRLGSAVLMGGLIGIEREIHGKEAGLRTHSLVCLGSALMMVVSIQMHEVYRGITAVDPSRIAAQVVSGIGFLGAGVIMRDTKEIKGITTAAGIWVASGIGLACGLGLYRAAVLSTLLSLFILVVFSKIDQVIWQGKDS